MEPKRLIKAYIIDDDLQATALLQKLLEDYSVEIIGTANDIGPDTNDDLIEQEPDLLFLDVELPSGSGLDFYSGISPLMKHDMRVVFYTGYDKYMLEALRRQAFDYLLKPASKQELAKIMTRFYEDMLSNILPHAGRHDTSALPSVMIVNAINEHTVLRFTDIAFFRFVSERRLWEVITATGECHQLRHRTTADIILGYSPEFIQIHKRYIVNIHHIQKVLDNLCVLRPPLEHINELRISKNYRPTFMSIFYNM